MTAHAERTGTPPRQRSDHPRRLVGIADRRHMQAPVGLISTSDGTGHPPRTATGGRRRRPMAPAAGRARRSPPWRPAPREAGTPGRRCADRSNAACTSSPSGPLQITRMSAVPTSSIGGHRIGHRCGGEDTELWPVVPRASTQAISGALASVRPSTSIITGTSAGPPARRRPPGRSCRRHRRRPIRPDRAHPATDGWPTRPGGCRSAQTPGQRAGRGGPPGQPAQSRRRPARPSRTGRWTRSRRAPQDGHGAVPDRPPGRNAELVHVERTHPRAPRAGRWRRRPPVHRRPAARRRAHGRHRRARFAPGGGRRRRSPCRRRGRRAPASPRRAAPRCVGWAPRQATSAPAGTTIAVGAQQARTDQHGETDQHRSPQQPPDPRHPAEHSGRVVARGAEDVLGAHVPRIGVAEGHRRVQDVGVELVLAADSVSTTMRPDGERTVMCAPGCR